MSWLLANWRGILFRTFGLLLLLFLFDGPFFLADLLVPVAKPQTVLGWIGLSHATYPPGFDPTRPWHLAQLAAIGILLGGSMFALWRRPASKPLVFQYFVSGMLAISVTTALSEPQFAAFALIFGVAAPGLLVALYPGRLRSLVTFSPERPLSPALLVLSALVTIGVGYDVLRHLPRLTDAGPDLAFALAVLMASTRRPGWKPLGIITGLALGQAGLAAISLADQPNSWGLFGGSLALAGGLAFFATTLRGWQTAGTLTQRTESA